MSVRISSQTAGFAGTTFPGWNPTTSSLIAEVAMSGTDYGVHSPTFISRSTDMTRQAAAYRDRRVLLAGDSAHVHAPDGGQGLNLGVHDAPRRADERTTAARETVSELLAMDEPRKRFAAMMSGLDIHYDLGEGHPLLGRRMPDLDLVTANGPLRVYTLLHDARPLFLTFGSGDRFARTPWPERVKRVTAESTGS